MHVRTLEPLVLDKLLTAVDDGEVPVGIAGDDITGLEPPVCSECRGIRGIVANVSPATVSSTLQTERYGKWYILHDVWSPYPELAGET